MTLVGLLHIRHLVSIKIGWGWGERSPVGDIDKIRKMRCVVNVNLKNRGLLFSINIKHVKDLKSDKVVLPNV